MITIKQANKRTVTFECLDQDNQPAIGADGQPLQPVGVPVWSLGELVASRVASGKEITGATLVPSADGFSCDVIADVAGVSFALHTYADRGDGVQVHGGSIFETVGETGGSVPAIAYLKHVYGEEVPA